MQLRLVRIAATAPVSKWAPPPEKPSLWARIKAIPSHIAASWKKAWEPTWAGVPNWVFFLWEKSGDMSLNMHRRLQGSKMGQTVINALGVVMSGLWAAVDKGADWFRKSPKPPAPPTGPLPPALAAWPTSLTWLSTKGNQILDAKGAPVRLRGINLSGLELQNSKATPATAERLDWIAAQGGNVLRMPINQGRVLNEPGYMKMLDDTAREANKRGIYVLFDMHWISGHQTATLDAESPKMWRQVANRYANQPGVIFDLHNEPGMIGWKAQKAWSEATIAAMRGVHPRSLVFVEGTTKGQRLAPALKDPINAPNVVYEVHAYGPLQHGPGVGPAQWDRLFGKVADRYPVFVGEFGGRTEEIYALKQLVAYMDGKGLGWAAWHSSNDLFEADGRQTPLGDLVAESLQH